MKDLLTFFLRSTQLTLSRKLTNTAFIFNSFPLKISSAPIWVCLLVMMVASSGYSQSNASAAISTPITTDAYDHTVWKTSESYNAVINAEKSETLDLLEDPNLTPDEKALYTGYARLLDYIKVDLDANLPIANIAYLNFKKVVLEATTDPNLVNMSVNAFQLKYDALNIRLHQ